VHEIEIHGNSALSWSPDGTQIAATLAGTGTIALVEVETGIRLLPFMEHPGYLYDPAWSPDGEVLAMLNDVGDHDNLVLVRVDTGELVYGYSIVTNVGERLVQPVWEPNGESLVFMRWSEPFWQLVQLGVEEGEFGFLPESQPVSTPVQSLSWYPGPVLSIVFTFERAGQVVEEVVIFDWVNFVPVCVTCQGLPQERSEL